MTNILLLPLFYEIEEPRQSKTKYYDLRQSQVSILAVPVPESLVSTTLTPGF